MKMTPSPLRFGPPGSNKGGASVILKDKIDTAPAGSGLSPDVFIFCIQTAFERFNLIGKDFLGIDATHCHGRCILLSLIFYFKRHVTVGYFT